MSAQRRVTTRPEKKAEAVTDSWRADSREALASLNISVESPSEPLPGSDSGHIEARLSREFRLTMLILDPAQNSRLSLRLT